MKKITFVLLAALAVVLLASAVAVAGVGPPGTDQQVTKLNKTEKAVPAPSVAVNSTAIARQKSFESEQINRYTPVRQNEVRATARNGSQQGAGNSLILTSTYCYSVPQATDTVEPVPRK